MIVTDGHFIYQLTGDRMMIVHAEPGSPLSLTGTVNFADSNFYPQELYVDGNRVVVIGSDWGERIYPLQRMSNFGWMQGTVKARVYDTQRKDEPRLVREMELTGTHISSRKVGDQIYLISRKYPDYYSFLGVNSDWSRQGVAPRIREVRANRGRPIKSRPAFSALPLSRIFYFPGFEEPSYLILSSFSIADDAAPARHTAYLGAGEVVYASQSNLYLSVSQLPSTTADDVPQGSPAEETLIHKFSIAAGRIKHAASGIVPGRVLNQFSMDEHEGLFRIATTRLDNDAGTPITSSGIYVLNSSMETIGSVEGLAPGEQIFSARFAGTRAYLVTFEQIDPFFVLDLSVAEAPQVLGELKIPGFSTYLHPYDEHHVIGIGRETSVITNAPPDQPWMENMVWDQGMKVTLFDVRDVTNPVERSTLRLGDAGTYSEAQWNHKAMLFDRNERLLAFPVAVARYADGVAPAPFTYGEMEFRGAAIMDIGLDTGISYRDGITHIEGETAWWMYDREIRRILRIGNLLYSVSDTMITAHDLDTLTESSRLITGNSAPPEWFFPAVSSDPGITSDNSPPLL